MCGVLGIYSNGPVAQDVYDGLIALQHRGQDACGMVTYDGRFHLRKNLGLVRDVFHTRHMRNLKGYAGIGHTRYSTIGAGGADDAQPFLGQSPFGVMFAHNGNIFNGDELKKEMYENDHRLINSDCDAEILLNLFTKSLSNQNADHIESEHIWKAVKSVHDRAKGAYSVVTYVAGQGMAAFRDPHGIRPLLFGRRKNGLKDDYIFASESIALDLLGFEIIDDVAPGEAIFIDEHTREVTRKIVTQKNHTPCLFEHIYFARPDSLLDQISVYKSRSRMGRKLAKKIKELNLDIDVVMPVPDSSRTATIALADELNIKYSEGLVKNRYIGRTFIMPNQAIRKKSIKYKLNPMKMEIDGKKILLVDDSIVRGNTSKKIVEVMRKAGAEKIYFISYAPPVKHPCLYGVDVPTRQELIAANNSVEDIRKFMNADVLLYGELEDAKEACIVGNKKIKDMCMACFDGDYKKNSEIDEEILKRTSDARIQERTCARKLEDEEGGDQLNLI